MTIEVGDKIPTATLRQMTADGPQEISTEQLFSGKKVVVFGLPGAFTPTCSAKHVPGFVQHAGEIKSKGVDTIACVSVNDAFVMGAWGDAQGTGDDVVLAADGAGSFTQALGLEFDLSGAGLGVRSQRFAAIVDDGTVTVLNVDAGGKLESSDAETILAAL